MFLAGCFELFGEDPWPVRYVQAILSALACVFIYQLGRELAGSRAGFVAGLLAAVHPSFILFTGRILTETLSIFFVSFGLLALVKARRVRPLAWMSVAGFAIALCALTRPTMLSVIPFAILAVAVSVPWRWGYV